jgi:hypothetical protein
MTMTANYQSNEVMNLTEMADARSTAVCSSIRFIRRVPALKSILVTVGVAILAAGCSAAESENLALPAAAASTSLSRIEPIDGGRIFKVTVWRIPVVLSVDYVPG